MQLATSARSSFNFCCLKVQLLPAQVATSDGDIYENGQQKLQPVPSEVAASVDINAT
jgi:hypothetical protein